MVSEMFVAPLGTVMVVVAPPTLLQVTCSPIAGVEVVHVAADA